MLEANRVLLILAQIMEFQLRGEREKALQDFRWELKRAIDGLKSVTPA